jgi:glycine cleavage system aminomethyltransferase T
MGLRIEGEEAPPAGAEIWGAERSLGVLASAAVWPEAGAALGMGLVHRAQNAPGSRVSVRHEGRQWEAVLVERRGLLA